MTAMLNGPRPLTDTEREAVTLHMQKVPVPSIQIKTGLQPTQIAAAVELAKVHARLVSAPNPAPPTLAAATTPRNTAPHPKPEQEGHLTITKLLAWADASGQTRAMTLAARTRATIAELRTIHGQDEARTAAQAEVERLTAELEAAKARLRDAGGKTRAAATVVAPAPNPDRLTRTDTVRAWARGEGYEISDRGRIPTWIQDKYDAAHGGAQ